MEQRIVQINPMSHQLANSQLVKLAIFNAKIVVACPTSFVVIIMMIAETIRTKKLAAITNVPRKCGHVQTRGIAYRNGNYVMEATIAWTERTKRHVPAIYAPPLDANPVVNHHHLAVFALARKAINWMSDSNALAVTLMNARNSVTATKHAKTIGPVSRAAVWVPVFDCKWFKALEPHRVMA